MEEQTIPKIVQIVETNGTLQPTHDSRKSNGAVVVAASQWQGLLVFLLIVILLPQEMNKPCIQGFVARGISMSLVS
jgi:hypothetical protein